MKIRNFRRVLAKSLLRAFHFLPFDFFFILFMNLLLLSSFSSSLSALAPLPWACPFAFWSWPSMSWSLPPTFSLVYCNLIWIKFLQTLSCSSMCFSMLRCVKSSNTSCLFFFTLLITGMRNISEKKMAHEAAIKTYKNIYMFYWRLFSDSCRIASVEDFSALNTEFKLFYITKKTVTWLSTIDVSGNVEMRKALTTTSMITSQMLNVYVLGIFGNSKYFITTLSGFIFCNCSSSREAVLRLKSVCANLSSVAEFLNSAIVTLYKRSFSVELNYR